jgi:hypothetical protein
MTLPGRALLRLPLPDNATGRLRLHLALRGGAEAQAVTLRAGRGPRLTLDVQPGARPVAVLEATRAEPILDITIEAEDGIGVEAVMACAEEDVVARLGFLERLRFVWPELA